MSRTQHFGLAVAPLVFTSLLLGAPPSHAYLETLAFETQTVASQPSTAAWQTFRVKADGFQVSMPSQPVYYQLPDSQASAHMYMQMRLTRPDQFELYGVGVAQVPRPLTSPQEIKEMLASCAKLASRGEQKAKVTPMPIGNHPGVEVEEMTAQGRLRISRCYLVGQRFYMLLSVSEPMLQGPTLQPMNLPGGQPQRTDSMNQFLNSFQLLDIQRE